MKKIAIFLDNASNHAIYSRISGVFRTLYEENLDYEIYLYRSRGAWKYDEKYNIGEYNIFSLPDFSIFDAFILIFNDLSDKRKDFIGWKACFEVIDRVRKTGKPVITIGTKIEGMHNVSIDNRASMTALVRHLVEVHRCKNFWFIMGPEQHRESRERAEAITKYLSEWDNKDRSDYFYYESFNPMCGEHGFKYLYEKFEELPDAIICANDHIAIGACTEAARRGFVSPRDFLITGFDDIDMASCHTPSLTTIDQRWSELGRICMDYIKASFAGEDYPMDTTVYTQMHRRQSCGCETRTPDEASDLFNENRRQNMEQESFNRRLLKLENDLLMCGSVREIGEAYAQMLSYMKSDSLYLVLDRRFYSDREQDSLFQSGDPGESLFLTKGYPPNMQLAFICENDTVVASDLPVEKMYSAFARKPSPKDYLFLPVHFGELSVGYIVIAHAEHLIRSTYLVRAIQMLLSAIENFYIRSRLSGANSLLARASITDAMTGFYNRLGYQEIAYPFFEEHLSDPGLLAVMFADMDNMKQINDRFGHASGDNAILSVAQAIRRACPDNSVICRMGGDEFMILARVKREEQIEQIITSIRDELPKTEAAKRLDHAPSVSIGYVICDPASNKNLDDYVKLSDSLMYEEKRRHKNAGIQDKR